jgi:hypothetical protein
VDLLGYDSHAAASILGIEPVSVRMDDQPSPPVVEHYDGSAWTLVDMATPSTDYVVPFAVAAVSPSDVWVAGWTNTSNSATRYREDRAFVSHWDGDHWALPDVGLAEPPQVVRAAGVAPDGTVWLVGRRDGDFAPPERSFQDDTKPLVLEGSCASG